MKKILAFLLDFARGRVGRATTFHDDNLRANQSDRRHAFSYWRALVS
jgi:hypothetical protein